tara:strand:- start:595 stop:894 length:300 start_codon:yes stop_codon:yes gene_type:complete
MTPELHHTTSSASADPACSPSSFPTVSEAIEYVASLKDCHDCFADRAAIVLYDELNAMREEAAKYIQLWHKSQMELETAKFGSVENISFTPEMENNPRD